MQLDARAMRPVQHFRQRDQRGLLETAQRQLVLLVQAPVHAFSPELPPRPMACLCDRSGAFFLIGSEKKQWRYGGEETENRLSILACQMFRNLVKRMRR